MYKSVFSYLPPTNLVLNPNIKKIHSHKKSLANLTYGRTKTIFMTVHQIMPHHGQRERIIRIFGNLFNRHVFKIIRHKHLSSALERYFGFY